MARTTQDFVPIDEVRDGIAVLENGELRLVLMVSTMNFDLKGQDEQSAILLQYQNFLNSLDFSTQIYVQSRRFDIMPYIATLEAREKEETNNLLKIQIREYISFIRTLTEANNIMSKMFFVIVPFTPSLIGGKKGGVLSSLFGSSDKKKANKNERFEEYRSQIEQRRDVIIQGLAQLGLKGRQLGTEELIELFYKIFNPGESGAPVSLAQQTK